MPDLHLKFEDDASAPAVARTPFDDSDAIAMLETAEIVGEQLVPWGSNYTFAVALASSAGKAHFGIYKPQRGERPLWDFPTGTLFAREVASYRLSSLLGWGIVPPTTVRDGPYGLGSLQIYVEPAEERANDQEFWSRRIPEIERIVLFDHIANNADRKVGHCLVDNDGRIWGIDHGLTFNIEPKLRTVLWQFNGESIAPSLLADMRRLIDEPGLLLTVFGELLSGEEIEALRFRTESLLKAGHYPELDPQRNIPFGWW